MSTLKGRAVPGSEHLMARATDDEMIDGLQEDLRIAHEEIEQQRRHFRIETHNYEIYEKAARKEVADLKKDNVRLQALVDTLWSKVARARSLAREIAQI